MEHQTPSQQEWATYERPGDYDELNPSERLRELCSLKFAVYAPEVDRPSTVESSLRLFLWTVDETSPSSYSREFKLLRFLERPWFDIEVVTPRWQTHTTLAGQQKFELHDKPGLTETLVHDIYANLEQSTALPGPPESAYYYPDWLARHEACMWGRISEVCLGPRVER